MAMPKTELLNLILEKYENARERFDYYMNNKEELDKILFDGAAKARKVGSEVLIRVRKKSGLEYSIMHCFNLDVKVGLI
jgi:tryptophanyl-tRNA synthetase